MATMQIFLLVIRNQWKSNNWIIYEVLTGRRFNRRRANLQA